MSSATTTCVIQVSPSEQPFQGIGLILGGFECQQSKTRTAAGARSLRRTLSAVDISSPIVFSPSDEIHIDQEDIEQKNDLSKQPEQFDIWSSIPIQNPSSLPPPYVHPLVKKSKSCLSLKSLEICTENLGSESGSDGYPPSVIGLSDTEEEHEEIQEVIEAEAIQEVVVVVKVLNYSKKTSTSVIPRSFPPPLNSLSRPGGGIQMNTHRKDGRLVIEAVSVPASQNCFSAQRQDGRLVLTFTTPIPESKSESFDNENDGFETDDEVEFECSPGNEIEESIINKEENKGIVLKMTSTTRALKLQPAGVTNVHRSALMVNKFTGLTNNRNHTTTWSLSSLPILTPTLAAAEEAPARISTPEAAVGASCFNRFEYFLRKETSSIGGIYDSLNQQSLPNTKNTYYNNNRSILLVSKNNYCNSNNLFVKDSTTTTKGGEKDYKEEKQNSNGEKLIVDLHLIVPAYCKPELRRSLVLAPFCIAAS
ncbi:hypothetical protein C5167_041064 [Papaver somniferum]|uniref:FAF domain-containing protein n=1 Tax=Papaver somniferum TaxID=3469 RepID=A0A4Y7IGY0_PAPSO|nr:protein FAF-like, chloroplastic [Papaver somniferum]RZC48134.1 hypothetical protein C5167_041064 [Papaver somniferum]